MRKTVLVTGATGFIGKAIVAELQKMNFEVFTCGRSQDAVLPNYFQIDITDANSISAAIGQLPDLDAVIHSAGLAHQFDGPKEPLAFTRINVEGTRRVAGLAAAKGCNRFILISSISVYGDGKPNPCDEEQPCHPTGDYAVSKFEAENAAREICEKNEVDLCMLRMATVYGPGDPGNVLRLIKSIDGGRFIWAGGGGNSKSLISVADAARAAVIAFENMPWGTSIFNVTDEPHTMREIVETIADALGKKKPSLSLPAFLVESGLKVGGIFPVAGKRFRNLSATLKKWRSDDVLSGERIKEELRFQPQISLKDGIEEEVTRYRDSQS
jgi:nucleoside-diphosphate-sugar epimerase